MNGTAKTLHMCGEDLRIGDFIKVRYTRGVRQVGMEIQGKIIEMWSPERNRRCQVRLESGWCFHDHDKVLELRR